MLQLKRSPVLLPSAVAALLVLVANCTPLGSSNAVAEDVRESFVGVARHVHAGSGEVREESRRVTVAAVVRHGDGSPAEGAVVVTSAGGKGVSDARGVVRFEVDLPLSVAPVHVTAMATVRGINSVGTKSVHATRGDDDLFAGDIELAAGADCDPDWIPTFGGGAGVNSVVEALTVFDDGSGPALYLGGHFTSTTDELEVNAIVKWDGNSWSPLGNGLKQGNAVGQVHSLAVFDDGLGDGPALYAGGFFNTAGDVAASHIARWNGSSWSSVGTGVSGGSPNAIVHTLAVFDDGTGASLYAAGNFLVAGGVTVNRIARWDGLSWSGLGSGLDGRANSLAVFDDGDGPALYVGGNFDKADGVVVNKIARWNGVMWSSLGTGMSGGSVEALGVIDGGQGSGPALYAGGGFSIAGSVSANRIARWDGFSWSPLGEGVAGGVVLALMAFDDGSGPVLYAGGTFTSAGGVPTARIARWDGFAWAPLGSGVTGGPPGTFQSVRDLVVWQGGGHAQDVLYVGGHFYNAGGMLSNHVAQWNDAQGGWQPISVGLNDRVSVLSVLDDGSGPALYVGGYFGYAGNTKLNGVAKWDGSSWMPLGSGFSGFATPWVAALTLYDDGLGDGPALYAGGFLPMAGDVQVNNIARWNGETWLPLGEGVAGGSVNAMAVYDDGSGGGPALYVGGSFTTAGGQPANRIARWDGETWSTVGGGVNSWVADLVVHDDGHGPALYVGGLFTLAGGVPANRIARWSGTDWSPLGTGMNNRVIALTVFDDGSGNGPALYAGGWFTTAGDIVVNRIAKWPNLPPIEQQQNWLPVGEGFNDDVSSLEVFDDGSGSGPALYVGGRFTFAGGMPANRIAKWNGKSWSTLGEGILSASVAALAGCDLGAGPVLYLGGGFTTSPEGDSFLAKWGGCAASESFVHFNLRPGACPNPLNTKTQGVLPAAILGEAGFDVSVIDVASLLLSRADGVGGSVTPLGGPPGPGIKIKDVGTPFTGPDPCDCHDLGGDGIDDLTLKFNIPELVAALELAQLPAGTSVELQVTGQLLDGTPFSGTDCITIVGQGNQPGESQFATGGDPGVLGDLTGDGHVGIGDLLALLAAWGQCPDPDNCPADLDGDGSVGIADLLILLAN